MIQNRPMVAEVKFVQYYQAVECSVLRLFCSRFGVILAILIHKKLKNPFFHNHINV